MMGIVGSLVIARWSYGLLRDTSGILLDGSIPLHDFAAIRDALQSGSDGDVVSDLHVWPLGPGQLAVVAAIISDEPRPPEHYKKLLADRSELVHLTVEVNRCR